MRLHSTTKEALTIACSDGTDYASIAEQLNSGGHTTPQGKKFKSSTVGFWARKLKLRRKRYFKHSRTTTRYVKTHTNLADVILEIMVTKLSDDMKKKLINAVISE